MRTHRENGILSPPPARFARGGEDCLMTPMKGKYPQCLVGHRFRFSILKFASWFAIRANELVQIVIQLE
jgi:hypothetical protein